MINEGLELLEPSAARIEAAILDVASAILTGTIATGLTEQAYGDQKTVQEYMESLEDLLGILRSSKTN